MSYENGFENVNVSLNPKSMLLHTTRFNFKMQYFGCSQKSENIEQKLFTELKKFVITKVTTNGYTLVKLGF